MKRFVVFEKCRVILLLGITCGLVLGSAQTIDSRQHDLLGNEMPGLHLSLFPQPGLPIDGMDAPQDLCPVVEEPNRVAEVEESEPKEAEPEPPFHGLILQAADRHQVDPALIKAIIMAESGYNPKAVSKKGARGLMQLMPRTAKSLGVQNSLDPEHNINGGVKYFRQLLDRFDGNVKLALAAYNAGARYVRQYQGVPPFGETRLYIKKVMKLHRIYEREMNAENHLGISVKS
jgi:Transglycosylase SLT domain